MHGDHLFSIKDYDSANEQYLKTIGFVNPSYVIQKFINVQFLPLLVKYLEILTTTKSKKEDGDSKDYTALLVNCYVKL